MCSSDLSNSILTRHIDDDQVTGDQLADAIDVVTSVGVGGGSTNGVSISQGAIAIKNGGTKSRIDLYCESSNAHYTRLEAAAHASYSGNPVVTLPTSTGRTHQIRFHCYDAGYPILGDEKYSFKENQTKAQRLMLHAKEIIFMDGEKKIHVKASENYNFFDGRDERT